MYVNHWKNTKNHRLIFSQRFSFQKGKDFVESNIFKKKSSAQGYYGEDLITGHINDVKMSFSETKAVIYGSQESHIIFNENKNSTITAWLLPVQYFRA